MSQVLGLPYVDRVSTTYHSSLTEVDGRLCNLSASMDFGLVIDFKNGKHQLINLRIKHASGHGGRVGDYSRLAGERYETLVDCVREVAFELWAKLEDPCYVRNF